MQITPTILVFYVFCSNVLIALAQAACQNSCFGIQVMYPFGTGMGCGSPVFEQYINCTRGRLRFYTSSGRYDVQSIDYTNSIVIIQDPRMSTCSSMHNSTSGFDLPVGAPFSIDRSTLVLLACSTSSPAHNSPSPLCDPSGLQICRSLYSCPSIIRLGLTVNAPTSSCCVYSSTQTKSPPYRIDVHSLQCASYTSIYAFGPQFSYGTGPSSNNKHPNSWSYGIALNYSNYNHSSASARCKACERSGGGCTFNANHAFVCVCPGRVRTTSTRCLGMSHGTTANLHRTLWTVGLSVLVGMQFWVLS